MPNLRHLEHLEQFSHESISENFGELPDKEKNKIPAEVFTHIENHESIENMFHTFAEEHPNIAKTFATGIIDICEDLKDSEEEHITDIHREHATQLAKTMTNNVNHELIERAKKDSSKLKHISQDIEDKRREDKQNAARELVSQTISQLKTAQEEDKKAVYSPQKNVRAFVQQVINDHHDISSYSPNISLEQELVIKDNHHEEVLKAIEYFMQNKKYDLAKSAAEKILSACERILRSRNYEDHHDTARNLQSRIHDFKTQLQGNSSKNSDPAEEEDLYSQNTEKPSSYEEISINEISSPEENIQFFVHQIINDKTEGGKFYFMPTPLESQLVGKQENIAIISNVLNKLFENKKYDVAQSLTEKTIVMCQNILKRPEDKPFHSTASKLQGKAQQFRKKFDGIQAEFLSPLESYNLDFLDKDSNDPLTMFSSGMPLDSATILKKEVDKWLDLDKNMKKSDSRKTTEKQDRAH
ncbi:hypothetical protein HON22_04540 [Candidatus Peregrinibacteria bacterium]|jgi:hypothetical protein|nr:hypothetical protein [Candidatus Peregrinibacteria bacterium]